MSTAMQTGRQHVLHQHEAAVTCLATHQLEAGLESSHCLLLCGFKDGSVMAWEVASRQRHMHLRVHAAPVGAREKSLPS